jgi:hypothetical protein
VTFELITVSNWTRTLKLNTSERERERESERGNEVQIQSTVDTETGNNITDNVGSHHSSQLDHRQLWKPKADESTDTLRVCHVRLSLAKTKKTKKKPAAFPSAPVYLFYFILFCLAWKRIGNGIRNRLSIQLELETWTIAIALHTKYYTHTNEHHMWCDQMWKYLLWLFLMSPKE